MANGYYDHGTYPVPNTVGSSQGMRSEFDAIMGGFDLLPDSLGLGLKGFIGGKWTGPTIVGGTVDGAAVGSDTPAAGYFTTLIAGEAATFSGGGTLSKAFTAAVAASLQGFAISGGTIDGVPVGAVFPAALAATTLKASGATALYSTLNVNGAFNLKSGILEFGEPSALGMPNLDFHSSAASADYDSRLQVSGGSATAGQGTLALVANAISFGIKPVWAGATPWDNVSLPTPMQTPGGVYTGSITMASTPVIAYTPLLTLKAGTTFSSTVRAYFGDTSIQYLNNAQDTVNLSVLDSGAISVRGGVAFGVKPTWNAGVVPWDSATLTTLAQLSNTPGFLAAAGTIQNATHSTYAEFVSNDAVWMHLHWVGQGGTPAWVWGSYNDPANHYPFQTSSWSVNFANSASFATAASSVNGVSSMATSGSLVQRQNSPIDFGFVSQAAGWAVPQPYFVVGVSSNTGASTANNIHVYGAPFQNQ